MAKTNITTPKTKEFHLYENNRKIGVYKTLERAVKSMQKHILLNDEQVRAGCEAVNDYFVVTHTHRA